MPHHSGTGTRALCMSLVGRDMWRTARGCPMCRVCHSCVYRFHALSMMVGCPWLGRCLRLGVVSDLLFCLPSSGLYLSCMITALNFCVVLATRSCWPHRQVVGCSARVRLVRSLRRAYARFALVLLLVVTELLTKSARESRMRKEAGRQLAGC